MSDTPNSTPPPAPDDNNGETPLDDQTQSLLESLGEEIAPEEKSDAADDVIPPTTPIAEEARSAASPTPQSTPNDDVPAPDQAAAPTDDASTQSTEEEAPQADVVTVDVSTDDVEDTEGVEASTPAIAEIPPTPPPPTYRYRIVMQPTEAVQEMIQAAVEAVKLEKKVVRGYLQWHAAFQTRDEPGVTELLRAWAKKHLPLTVELTSVYSAVQGQRTYSAGWKLHPTDKLQAAHRHMIASLGSIITVEATANTTFHPRLALSVDVPAGRFPRLVAHLQQHFTPTDWEMAGCELQRFAIEPDGTPKPNARWETAQQISIT